ncbi:MAG TPA: hypothetical protein VMB47_00650 [Candidatus Aquilonibacter sp.]|nr:hypothetical protein [Candidatus Aquilonibacter sp.]
MTDSKFHLERTWTGKTAHRAAKTFFVLAAFLFALPVLAQDVGPIQGGAPKDDNPWSVPQSPPNQPAPQPVHRAGAAPEREHYESAITRDPPAQPVEQIIQKFAASEDEFREERDNFTYTQDFVVETIDDNDQPDGEYHVRSDVTFTPDGKRYEQIVYAPPPTLERISLSTQDLDDLKNVQPFVLTTAELPKYDITYVGRQTLDEIGTYVFDVAPKRIEKNQRYFQGRIWVDNHDLEIVKTDGKAVPDIRKGDSENVFPRFETYRENIEGHFWFPTYTHSDDVLHFRYSDVHIRMTVRYTNYKRFRVSVRLLSPTQPIPDQPASPATPAQPPSPSQSTTPDQPAPPAPPAAPVQPNP